MNIIKAFAEKDSRIKVIAKENRDYGNSINRGITLAVDRYIGIVDSDKFIAEKCISLC